MFRADTPRDFHLYYQDCFIFDEEKKRTFRVKPGSYEPIYLMLLNSETGQYQVSEPAAFETVTMFNFGPPGPGLFSSQGLLCYHGKEPARQWRKGLKEQHIKKVTNLPNVGRFNRGKAAHDLFFNRHYMTLPAALAKLNAGSSLGEALTSTFGVTWGYYKDILFVYKQRVVGTITGNTLFLQEVKLEKAISKTFPQLIIKDKQ